MTSRRAWRQRQQDRIALGLDPENTPLTEDQPTCDVCGRVLVCRPRARVCEYCQKQAA